MSMNPNESDLWFAARRLPRAPQYVNENDLSEGEVYFAVSYLDDAMLIPELTPLVFLGRRLEGDDEESMLHFQDYDSYRQGVRWKELRSPDVQGVHGTVLSIESGGSTDVSDYEHALEILLRCSLRRTTVK